MPMIGSTGSDSTFAHYNGWWVGLFSLAARSWINTMNTTKILKKKN